MFHMQHVTCFLGHFIILLVFCDDRSRGHNFEDRSRSFLQFRFGILPIFWGFLLGSHEMTSHNGAWSKPNASSNFTWSF